MSGMSPSLSHLPNKMRWVGIDWSTWPCCLLCMHVYMCVCVCVRERERERERNHHLTVSAGGGRGIPKDVAGN